MPVTRRSMGVNVLQPISDNVLPIMSDAKPTATAISDTPVKPIVKPTATATATTTATTAGVPAANQAGNPAKAAPGTPSVTPRRQVKALRAEVEKKDAENDALRGTIADLTTALAGLNVVKEKIDVGNSTTNVVNVASAADDGSNVDEKKKGKREEKDPNAPVPAKTAYRFYCDAHPNKTDNKKKKGGGGGADMRQAWKECPPHVRQPYVTMAEADKARYEREYLEYEEQKAALELYYEKKRQDVAMEFLDAHVKAQMALEKANNETNNNKKKKKSCKKKKEKDPEAPKRPTSSYMYFVIEKRESVAKEHPTATPVQVTKKLGELWAEQGKSTEGVAKYEQLAAADRIRYEADKKAYDALLKERAAQLEKEREERLKQDKQEAMKLMHSFFDASDAPPHLHGMNEPDEMSTISELTNVKLAKKKKDPNAPKKASTAYLFYCNDNRATIKASIMSDPNSNVVNNAELLTEVGRRWKELADEEKAKYHQMAEDDKKRYAREMEKYNAMGGAEKA